MTYEREATWSILYRLFHWSFASSIITLIITGFYINLPWDQTMLEGRHSFPVASMRYIHFLAAYVFSGTLLIRFFLFIFGNKYERILDFAPITPRNIKGFFQEISYYLYLRPKTDNKPGHNSLAGSVFLVMFVLAVIQVISGFLMLYPENSFWQSWGVKIMGSQQQARAYHHLITWAFILFSCVHLYMVIWNDVSAKNGTISSIFSGSKFKKVEKA